ncbi:MAG: hypothetical protein LBF27_01365 [Sphingobacterium sp.]|jgi:hypothetical protein|nr:hypothetical protein [Sphingobacterium sp.]
MEKYFTKLIALDLTFYRGNQTGYNPIREIEDFWEKYDLKNCLDYGAALIDGQMNGIGNRRLAFETDGVEEFLINLVQVLTSYYIAHDQQVDLRVVDLSTMSSSMSSASELKLAKEIYEFFNRVSTDLKNKL